MKAWVNGSLVDDSLPQIRLDDHGFTVGDGVFETVRTIEGKPFALGRHLDRLRHSATGLGLRSPDLDTVHEAIRQVIAANGAELTRGPGRIRITYTSGVGPPGSGRGSASTTLVVTASATKPWPATASVDLAPWPLNEKSPIAGLKTTSYAENAASLASVRERGYDEALLVNLRGELCEGTGSNVFIVLGNELITPPLDSGCLAGVTRGLVLQWCAGVERSIPMSALDRAEEVFLTSSTRGIHPVRQIGERRLVAPGKTTQLCQDLLAENIAADMNP